MRAKLAILGMCSTFFLLIPRHVSAQAGLGVTNHYEINAENIQGGEIISKRRTEYVLSSPSYDSDMFGVVSLEPAIEFGVEGKENSYPVVTTGVVTVKVNGQNGAIQAGDKVTSSSTPGIGMKATDTGFTLGTAESSFVPSSPEDTGTIQVAVEVKLLFREGATDSEKLSSQLTDVFNISALANSKDPMQTFRYVLAAGVLLGSLVLSFFTFLRLGSKGIEAAGRNPLASRVIFMSLGLNIVVSVAILAAGLGGTILLITYK